MLKALSASCRLPCQPPRIPARLSNGGETKPRLVRVLGSIRYPSLRNPVASRRAFFCSAPGHGVDRLGDGKVAGEVEIAEGGEAEYAESKAASAIVPTNPRPEDHLTGSMMMSKYSMKYGGGERRKRNGAAWNFVEDDSTLGLS
ncbi:putative lon protease, mitochondrial-like [Cocos nucifera]|uniref:Putative lon protease, mitochondrial-like n=1 Tax=Cocos nucifera TaxID=13894 RepID=A0A8K0IYU6_COCNU|nr:putative lon protease, mitochondrial-like [Cocos nucifera]